VPRTPDEFVTYWKASAEYKTLRAEIDAFEEEFPIGGQQYEAFKASRKAQQAKGQRVSSPYTLTYMQQIQLCLWRGWKRLIGNPEITLTQLFGNQIMAL
jgi:ATP-binding cassette subfamily G (WHITE) protein 2 (PDR)